MKYVIGLLRLFANSVLVCRVIDGFFLAAVQPDLSLSDSQRRSKPCRLSATRAISFRFVELG